MMKIKKRLIVALVSVCFFLIGCKNEESKPQISTIKIYSSDQIKWNKKTETKINYVFNRDSVLLHGKIKFRGGVSSKYYKHSYSLKFNDKVSLCNLPAAKSWILNANYIDKTFMRHKICYDLFRQMNENNIAPLCAYTMVYENENPQGLYVLMQRLTKSVLKVDKFDSTAVIFKDPKIFYKVLPDNDVDNPNYHEQIFPDFEISDKNFVIDSLRNFILNSDDEDFYARIGEMFDLNNIIDWHLLLIISNNGDGILKNFYLYKQNSESPYRIAIWDCDHSFGRDGDNEKNMLQNLLGDERNILLNRLMQNENYNKSLADRYKLLRKSGIFSIENFQSMMEENDKFIRLGLEDNLRLWPFDSEFYYDAASYDDECELMLEFVKLNLSRLDKMFY